MVQRRWRRATAAPRGRPAARRLGPRDGRHYGSPLLSLLRSPAAVLDVLAEQAERPLRWASMPSTHRPLPWLVAWRSHGTSSPKPGQSLCSLINSHMSLDCYYNLPVSVRSPGSTAAQGPLRTRLFPFTLSSISVADSRSRCSSNHLPPPPPLPPPPILHDRLDPTCTSLARETWGKTKDVEVLLFSLVTPVSTRFSNNVVPLVKGISR